MGLLNGTDRIHRDAFIYLDPVARDHTFAQCQTCRDWSGEPENLCRIHGPDVRVTEDMICTLYVPGPPDAKNAEYAAALVTPRESGLYKGQVRCENCSAFENEGLTCLLFASLNEALPHKFDLNSSVDPQGCCNAWTLK